jgi:hypothetical protein
MRPKSPHAVRLDRTSPWLSHSRPCSTTTGRRNSRQPTGRTVHHETPRDGLAAQRDDLRWNPRRGRLVVDQEPCSQGRRMALFVAASLAVTAADAASVKVAHIGQFSNSSNR